MFQPVEDFANGKYFANVQAWITAGGGPAPTNNELPRKQWDATFSSYQFRDNGNLAAGMLRIARDAAGRPLTVKVEEQSSQIDHIRFSTAIIPHYAGRFFTQEQHRFYTEYRHHADFAGGIPYFEVAPYPLDSGFRALLNFGSNGATLHPPILLREDFAIRLSPDGSAVQAFPMEAYRRANKPPAPAAAGSRDYRYSDLELAQQAQGALFDFSISRDEAGRRIRQAAEATK